jgi:hypothetical protein
MNRTKTTIYLPDDLRREVKKHLIDSGETLSAYTENALRQALKDEKSRGGKKRQRAKDLTRELDQAIKALSK